MIKIIAHRGFSKRYPENRMRAFKEAFTHHADGIECDIQKTVDGHYVVIHDGSIQTASNIQKKIDKITLNELNQIDIYKEEKILELKELLSNLPKGRIINIELKKDTLTEDDSPKIFDVLRNYLDRYNIIISSFSDKLLYYFKKQRVQIGLLFGKENRKMGILEQLKIILKLRPEYLNIPIDIFDDLGKTLCGLILLKARLFGRKIIFWVVNTETELKRIVRFSNMIITDNPESIYKSLKKIYSK